MSCTASIFVHMQVSTSHRAKVLYMPMEAAPRLPSVTPEGGDVLQIGKIICEMAIGRSIGADEVTKCANDIKWPRVREIVRRCVNGGDEMPTTEELVGMLKLLRNA